MLELHIHRLALCALLTAGCAGTPLDEIPMDGANSGDPLPADGNGGDPVGDPSGDSNGDPKDGLMANEVCWMGSMLTGTNAVELHASAIDPDAGQGFASLELYGPNGQLVLNQACAGQPTCSLDYTLLSSLNAYILARANYTDGGYLISSPIWLRT